MTPNIKNKVALISGSSAGIGAATAILFAQNGCHVAVTGRNNEKLQEVVDECRKHGVKVVSKTGNIDDGKHLKDLVDLTVKELGPIDILVNNAGGATTTELSLENAPLEAFDQTISLNVRSVIQLCKLCLPSLKQTHGCIINTSSIAALRPEPAFTYYCVAKAALDSLTQCLALEFAPYKIRVNGINPGIVRTSIADKMGISKSDAATFLDNRANQTLLKRTGESTDIAASIMFLAGSDAEFITGASLVVDGGTMVMGPMTK